MSTPDHLIHIELEATVTIKDDTKLPCSITLNLGEQNTPCQAETTSHDKVQDHQGSKNNLELKSEIKQNNKLNTEANHRTEIVKELFWSPDEVAEDMQNMNTGNTDLGLKIVSNSSPTKSSKDNLSGGGDKPISPKQKNLINKMANEQNKNVAEVVNTICNKSIDELKGHEADTVIKSMRKTRR